ncbi:MAG: ribonuclease Y [Oscillospiraceae bacterium]|jgi:ribonuclease Y|nr:ribonuclease Y [Oscillospiraceae bacterium]
MQGWLAALLIAVTALLALAAGLVVGMALRKKQDEETFGNAKREAARIVSEAMGQAEARKKELLLEAKEDIQRLRSDLDKESRERRGEVQRQEQRLAQKEESLDRKIDRQEKREEQLADHTEKAKLALAEAEKIRDEQVTVLEKIAGLTRDQACAQLLAQLEESLAHEKALRIQANDQRTREDSETLAREILATSIQRCSADHSAEVTVTSVALPNDEIKGRVIGREGRNVKTLESLTGADFIIDDTPDVITVSCFDPMRRKIAALTLEKLAADGRIHPAKVEEMFSKATREIENEVKRAGEAALVDSGVPNMHPDIVRLLGRLKYRTSFGQNVLKHSLEVSYLAGLMALELGCDAATVKLVKRAGLLHDIGKAIDHEQEGSHVTLGVEYARERREPPSVLHAIEAHHGDIEAKSLAAFLVQAADAISAARPGARRENVEQYVKRLRDLEEIAKSFDGVEGAFAMQAGREVRIVVQPDKINDDQMVIIAHDVVRRVEEELQYPGTIKVHVIRESRVIDIAK